MIFLDNASTTEMNAVVINEIKSAFSTDFYNISAKYEPSQNLAKMFNHKKSELIDELGARDGDIIITGSATIANNLVFTAVNAKNKGEVIVSLGEHPSVYEVAKKLKDNGANILFCPLTSEGCIDLCKFKNMVSENTLFVSCMHVNNETGAINNIKEVVRIAKSKNPNCLVHCDGVQAFMKIDVNLKELGVDFYTISAHKIGGPKGIGALWVKDKSKLKPFILGGGQEFNLVSGTENYPLLAGFVAAVKLKQKSRAEDFLKVSQSKELFVEALKRRNIEFKINGENTSPYILNVSFKGVRGEALLYLLSERNILVSNGSACSSHKRGNRILQSMGKTRDEIDGAIRFSFNSIYNYNLEEIAEIVAEEIAKIKH